MKDKYISAYRRRITVAALRRMKRKTGSNLLTVKRHDGELTTIEITEQFINQLLLRFEGVTRGEFGRKDGETAIRTAYQDAVGINQHGEYLTESGKLIIDELLNECIDYIKEGHITRCVNH
ncbi:TPA: hypothetical protein ACF9O0_005693 [Escherichia coli]|uniref:hypothetical protein n=1 Tax=Escherichia coli TaxID=562 RepID=UPI0004E36F2C|nr:hypothetical protein [Escherichia coli]HDQ6740409.1 hypothetical protein [Escherichia coli O128:H2]HDQ6919246.1 hypothetical protein [Escherichia coli O128AB:H2]EEY8552258.1 hypothetical protein [Escherichia coli]EFA9652612.1 hypothetical protein [Escherichia coli]EFF0395975.1 hypothetical protein [Escherichia coli]